MAVPPAKEDKDLPLIPFQIVDGPSQRLYVLAFYIALNAWRLYDYFTLVHDDIESLWLFLKWAAIDGVFIYGLPGLRIPWLEWSPTTVTVLFLFHALIDGLLMFRIPIPFEAWLVAMTKILYDRELSVSERRVKPGDILRNASVILGKQTIHILPEGSAMLNPTRKSFCLDHSRPSVNLPLQINQTSPILIEILRIDLETNVNETLTISAKQARALKKQADKGYGRDDVATPRYLHIPIKRTGLYRLSKVVDDSKLEVQRTLSDTLVVDCPRASVKATTADRCKGELSDFALEVVGVPPLRVRYSRTHNGEDRGFSFQTVQPPDLVSPLTRQKPSGVLVSLSQPDVSWARLQRIQLPLNESLNTVGSWMYSIDEVHDACGNAANYSHQYDDGETIGSKAKHLEQIFSVHERPKARLNTPNSQCILKVARGRSTRLPVHIDLAGHEQADTPYALNYTFTAREKLPANGEHSTDARLEALTLETVGDLPIVHEPGLYTLRTVSSRFCSGQVMEPATCLVVNPPQPDLKVSAESIEDKCAGSSVGLRVALDLTGTPPFTVIYEEEDGDTGKVGTRSIHVDGLRHHFELRPREAGLYHYRFKSVGDSVYHDKPLSGADMVLEQDVKPPASAHLVDGAPGSQVCIEEPMSFGVRLQGMGPWVLEYEVVHGGRRRKTESKNITTDMYTIDLGRLMEGGEYTLALMSVKDSMNCKIFLKEQATIHVRQQRPRASFGSLKSSRSTSILEGQRISLPLRLTGQAPWRVRYLNRNDSSASSVTDIKLARQNDVIEVRQQGVYELLEVRDAICPGTVDPEENTFSVQWIPRPQLKLVEGAFFEHVDGTHVKKDVCEGDEDAVEIGLSGTPPYHVKYQQRLKPDRGSTSLSNKEFTAGLGAAAIRMDTSQPGTAEYKFSELGDYLYDHDARRHTYVTVKQRIHARPSARFSLPGKTYRYCKEEVAGDEVIPLILQGQPPFHLEVGIKHHSSGKPEVVRIPNIETTHYDFRIPHHVLALGHHVVSVRKIRDGHGCERKADVQAPTVAVQVADLPSISPLEARTDYCVGDRIAYTLSGTPPFQVSYTFEGIARRATSTTTSFRRIAEKPGNFTITGITDGASDCNAHAEITRIIHEMPSVKLSKGKETVVDIHEGGTAELLFEFGGTPPFEYTYTRSATTGKGRRPEILETKHEVSHEDKQSIRTSVEGIYEVVAIRDRYCSFSSHPPDGGRSRKLLTL
ncbi:MAG: hypothetical protein M1817_004218 [Caeruleum heppii]|nr:MAG: hypothetical protein M1817_004218 [Caeruleum heppii]